MTAQARQRFSYESYLALEAENSTKHEFLAGEVWAMAGGTVEHAAIAANVIALLAGALRDSPCRVYSSDLRVRVLSTGLTTYPDVTVICDKPALDPDDRKQQTVVNPTLLCEILSPSTDAYDRGEKLAHYKQINTLREVVLVDHAERRIEVWSRSQGGEWTERTLRGSESLRLASIPCDLTIAEVYRA